MTSTFPATEDALQKQVVRHLSAVLPSDCFLHHSPNEGVRKVAFKMKLKSMGTQFGWPDLEIFAPDSATHNGLPQCLFIELKLAKGKLSEKQISIRDQLLRAGFPWSLCRSVEEVEFFLNKHIKLRNVA